jgi:serine/threonine protein phosphatase PrpC
MTIAADDERTGTLASGALEAAARSDRGPVRERNEDAFVCRPDLGVFAVIDGMGGQKGGPEAAAIAREVLLWEREPARALWTANERIVARAEQDRRFHGMGCVASTVRISGDRAHVGHVGDTRVYLAGEAACEQLTRDHTVAATRQEELGLADHQAKGIEGRNQVTRDLGGRRRDDPGFVDSMTSVLSPRDVLLMCSDGLHGVVPNADIYPRLRKARRENQPLDALADELVTLALARGTRDNVTVVLVRVSAGTNP